LIIFDEFDSTVIHKTEGHQFGEPQSFPLRSTALLFLIPSKFMDNIPASGTQARATTLRWGLRRLPSWPNAPK